MEHIRLLDVVPVFILQGVGAQDYHIVLSAGMNRLQNGAYLVYVYIQDYVLFRNGKIFYELPGTEHVFLLRIEGDENQIMFQTESPGAEIREHLGQSQENRYAGGVVVGSVVHVSVQGTYMVIVGGDYYIFRTLPPGCHHTHDISSHISVLQTELLEIRTVLVWAETVTFEQLPDVVGHHPVHHGTGGSPAGVIGRQV